MSEPFVSCPHGGEVRVINGQCMLVQQIMHRGITKRIPWRTVPKGKFQDRMTPREKLEIFLRVYRKIEESKTLSDDERYDHQELVTEILEPMLKEMGCPRPRMRRLKRVGIFNTRILVENESFCLFNIWNSNND